MQMISLPLGLNASLIQQGLSILLFAAAFMGNLFYVLSILSSPLVQEDEGGYTERLTAIVLSGR